GLLAPSGDAAALASRLHRLASEPALYEAMSAAALVRVPEYSIEACRIRYEALYQEVVRGRYGG
ncbi:MAG: glycosyltransferase, partial [Allosphingosinicella sp.]